MNAAGVLVAMVCAVALLMFGACTVVPGIEAWQAGNTDQAALRAQTEAAIAQLQAARDLEIAKAQAQRDIAIAKEQAAADVQRAAIDLAGRAVDTTAGTLRMVIVGLFSLCAAVLVAVAYLFDLRIRIGATR